MAAKKNLSPGQERRERGKKPVYDSYGRLSRMPETGELEKIKVQHPAGHSHRMGGPDPTHKVLWRSGR